jgi:hypothetical protein
MISQVKLETSVMAHKAKNLLLFKPKLQPFQNFINNGVPLLRGTLF